MEVTQLASLGLRLFQTRSYLVWPLTSLGSEVQPILQELPSEVRQVLGIHRSKEGPVSAV